MEVLAEQLLQNPALGQQMQAIEQHNQHYHQQMANDVGFRTVVTIPVVFHVIHNGDPLGTNENLPESLILAQLAQLNLDFALLNSDASLIPAIFQPVAANTEIQFCLAQRKPDGTATNGINRVQYSQASWTTSQINSTVKPATIWDRNQYLNIWTVVFGGSSANLLGYAQFPGGSASTDGVVVVYSSVGSVANPNPAGGSYARGRTATHEVGHWLNLRHIWGDATCGNDFVDDTPVHNASNSGCPTYPHYSTCTGTPIEMTMNYMDYTNDACMYMFTAGQKNRMQAVLATGGARVSLNNSLGCVPPGETCTAPTLAQLNASNITTSAARLNCTVTGVNAYDWRYRVAGTATWTDLPATTVNFVDLSSLLASTTYEFQAMVQCGSVWSAWSATQTFTTATATCTAPTLVQLSASNITTTAARLNCTVTGVNAYDWRYRAAGTATWTDLPATTVNFVDLSSLLASTTYEFQAMVQCGSVWSAWSATQTFTTLSAAICAAPTQAQLFVGDITLTSARFNCTLPGASAYDWRYRLVGASTWTDLPQTTVSNIEVTGLTPGGSYEFQAMVQCGGTTWSAWSPSYAFVMPTQPCDQPNSWQISISELTYQSARFTFAVTGYSAYRWRYKAIGAGSWIELPAVAVNYIDVTGLSSSTQYEVSVSIQCAGGVWSDWSAATRFITLPPPCPTPSPGQFYSTNVTSTTVQLNCIVVGVFSFDWRYRAVGAANWIDLNSTTSNFVVISGLNPLTAYEFQVSVQCASAWSAWSESAFFTTLPPLCTPPSVNQLSATNVTATAARLQCAVAGAVSYAWRYRISGSSQWTNTPNTGIGFVDISGLAPETTYEFQVALECVSNTTAWSASQTFTTQSTCPAPAAVQVFVSNITTVSALLQCSVTGVSAYRWRYRQVGASSWIDLGSSATGQFGLNGLVPETTYEFQAGVQCGSVWSAWSPSHVFTTNPLPCPAPLISEIFAGNITSSAANLNTTVFGVNAYDWRYRIVGAANWTDLNATASSFVELTGLASSTQYEFQVAVQCGSTWSAWSPAQIFTTLANPCIPPNLGEIFASNIGSNSARFNTSVTNVNAYHWRYRLTGASAWTDLPSTTVNYIDVTGLMPSSSYEFQVALSCGSTMSLWSFSMRFFTASSTRMEFLRSLSLELWPIPARNELSMRFTLAEDADVSIAIMDFGGQMVRIERKGKLAAGTFTDELDLSALPSGMYIVQMQAGKGICRERFVKLAD